jgi:signal transduction histidine kinase
VAENLTGYDEPEVIGKLTSDDFFSQDISKMINRPLIFDYGLELRGFKPMESEILNKNKEPIPVKLSGINLYEEGKHLGKVFSFQDMREVKRLRQDLIHSERLTATGEAVASISHSIKNILDGLVGGVHVYKMGSKRNDEKRVQNGWRMIEKNIDLISELVLNLLNYAKKREPVFQRCDPRTIVEDITGTMESKIAEKNIKVIAEYNGRFDNTYLDSYALHQCLMNLFSNAIDAIPSDGQGEILVRIHSENEHGVTFEVSDNGIGMNEGIKAKAFQGMFSTKGSKGTGLGLLVIQKIVSELGGTLDVQSEEGIGATFRIWIPNNAPVN